MNKGEQIKLKALHTNLMVNDVESTICYYEKIGFQMVQKVPDKKPEWAFIKMDNATLMFQSSSSLQKEFPLLKEQKMGIRLNNLIKKAGLMGEIGTSNTIIIFKTNTPITTSKELFNTK